MRIMGFKVQSNTSDRSMEAIRQMLSGACAEACANRAYPSSSRKPEEAARKAIWMRYGKDTELTTNELTLGLEVMVALIRIVPFDAARPKWTRTL